MARPAAMGYFELLPGPSLRQCCSWTRCPPQGDFALWPHARGGRRVLTAQGAVCRGGSCYSENALCGVNATVGDKNIQRMGSLLTSHSVPGPLQSGFQKQPASSPRAPPAPRPGTHPPPRPRSPRMTAGLSLPQAPGWAWATCPGVATAPLCPLVLPKTQPARRHPVPHHRPSPRPSASLPCPHPVPAASWPSSFAAFPPCPL